MKRSWVWPAAVGAGIVMLSAVMARAGEECAGKPIVGVDLGLVQPTRSFDKYSGRGGLFSPFVGYMFNKNLGLMGQLQLLGAPNFNRVGIKDDDATWAVGGAAGPRLAVPIGDGEIYGTAQGGIFTGLAGHSSITDTSFGFSVGGGINGKLNDKVMLGAFGRFNRLYQRVHYEHDVEYVTVGLSLTYDLSEPPPPPPPAIVQAPPPPPPPAPAPKKKIVLRGVNFDFDKADIRADARPVLDEAAAVLRQEGRISIVTAGHTDSRGSEEYNQKLSLRRAGAVKDFLVKGGVDAARIGVEGYGESNPVASNDTDDGRAQNRRVELRVVE